MKYLHLLLLMILAMSIGAKSSESCSLSGQVHYALSETADAAKLALRITNMAAALDFPGFCKWNRMDRLAESLDDSTKLQAYREAKIEGDMKKAVEILIPTAKTVEGPWRASLLGEESLKASAENSLIFVDGSYHHDPKKILDIVSKPSFKGSYRYSRIKPLKVSLSDEAELSAGCESVGITDFNKCETLFADAELFMSPGRRKTFPIIAPEVFKRLLTDRSLTKGLQLSAIESLSDEVEGNTGGKNLFPLLKDSFVKASYSNEEAEEKAWDVLYLYSVGGPNFSMRVADYRISEDLGDFLNPNSVYGQALFQSIPNRDGTFAGSGKSVFSLPKGSNFPCDTGKSYHFWMTAYLARHLVSRGHDKEDSARIAFLFAIGYHQAKFEIDGLAGSIYHAMEGSGMGKTGFIDYARFGTLENSVRLDINLAASGAVFGASGGEKVSDIQKGFIESMKFSSFNPNGVRVENHSREWLQRYRPDKIIDFYLE